VNIGWLDLCKHNGTRSTLLGQKSADNANAISAGISSKPLDLRHVSIKMIQFILKRTPVGPLLGDRAARTKYLQQMR
jgi:hypothetical protein